MADRWNGTLIQELRDEQIVQILRSCKRFAELIKRAIEWAFCEMQESTGNLMRTYLDENKFKHREKGWRTFMIGETDFAKVEAEAERRQLQWDAGEPIDSEVDLSQRGPLERQVVGAVRDCINSHGPITIQLAHSAAKRVVGAIKNFNRKVKEKR